MADGRWPGIIDGGWATEAGTVCCGVPDITDVHIQVREVGYPVEGAAARCAAQHYTVLHLWGNVSTPGIFLGPFSTLDLFKTVEPFLPTLGTPGWQELCSHFWLGYGLTFHNFQWPLEWGVWTQKPQISVAISDVVPALKRRGLHSPF